MSATLTFDDGSFLVKIAREAVKTYLKEGRQLKPPKDSPKKLWEKRGVFVTINRIEEIAGRRVRRLRGCIGYPEPIMPLIESTIDAAISAATSDIRFEPINLGEVGKIVFEVSVLTPMELVTVAKPKDYLKMIKVGRDGLMIERGFFKGLLLPQVAVEWRWSEEEFLSECCIKAGLPPDAWLLEGTKVYKFQCEIFEELEPEGGVIKREFRPRSELVGH